MGRWSVRQLRPCTLSSRYNEALIRVRVTCLAASTHASPFIWRPSSAAPLRVLPSLLFAVVLPLSPIRPLLPASIRVSPLTVLGSRSSDCPVAARPPTVCIALSLALNRRSGGFVLCSGRTEAVSTFPVILGTFDLLPPTPSRPHVAVSSAPTRSHMSGLWSACIVLATQTSSLTQNRSRRRKNPTDSCLLPYAGASAVPLFTGDAPSASFAVDSTSCGILLRRACQAIGGNSRLSVVLAQS